MRYIKSLNACKTRTAVNTLLSEHNLDDLDNNYSHDTIKVRENFRNNVIKIMNKFVDDNDSKKIKTGM